MCTTGTLRLICLGGAIASSAFAADPLPEGVDEFSAYLFAYFTGNGRGQEQIHFAVSEDGFNYRALNGNRPIIDSRDISTSGGVRDPHILRGEDGTTFYMVATDLYVPRMGWSNHAMVLMKSTDLIRWDSAVVNIPEIFPEEFGNVHRVWAPQTIYDKEAGKYMIYFSMKEGDDADIIYYAYANEEFTGLETTPRQLYFPPAESNNRACIDGDIIHHDGKYYLFHKAEDGNPGIKLAISDRLTEGYELHSNERIDREREAVEGSGVFKLNNSDEWILMYDVYMRGRYQFARSTDLMNFEIIDEQISMDFRPRHGSVLPITRSERLRLLDQWGALSHFITGTSSTPVRAGNVFFDDERGTIHLPLRDGSDPSRVNPGFETISGASLEPQGEQDFSGGPVKYTLTLEGGASRSLEVTAAVHRNPVLEGYFADPDIIYSEKTGRFYLYPTSDGYHGWSGTYFKAFSSEDLVNWTDEGVILDLERDVEWTSRNAWAPAMIEREIDGEFRYYFYFSAAQRIGVAVADHPAGPFKDSGKPLVDTFPEGVRHGQHIDPDVFRDPASGRFFLYWGNGYLAGAELNDDMVSIKEGSVRVMTPDQTFREGIHVFYREGKYYFLWSEDDTRSENYRVRYAMADSPMGPLEIPADNLVIAKDPERGIYGTGHNSVIQIPGRDEWYIVYHRFNYPEGIKMGGDAGFHRETCIDRMEFDSAGRILRVQPTLEGILPVAK
jgi:arabinoxylan arabinofuranohydrolase